MGTHIVVGRAHSRIENNRLVRIPIGSEINPTEPELRAFPERFRAREETTADNVETAANRPNAAVVIDAIELAETPEAIDALVVGETRKTVLAAAETRKAKLAAQE